MAKFSDWEKTGIRDFLASQQTNEVSMSLAKIVSKNIITPTSLADAIDVILLHSNSIYSILNRKAITKEILFKYLHGKKVPVTTDFTKQLLIEKTIEFWQEKFANADNERINEKEKQIKYHEESSTSMYQTHLPDSLVPADHHENFPINQMSRRFATWFFQNLNTFQLQATDFWRNCVCSSQFLEQNICAKSEEYVGAEACMLFCQSLRTQYGLFFNLNVAHCGTQGRIDCHGLVLVLSCGTLHKVDEIVGTFECVFALSRDPFCDNNWKINRISLKLHNATQSNAIMQPTLEECQSIAPLLALQMPSNSEGID